MGFGVLDYLYLGILGNHNFDNNGKMVSTGNVGRSAELSRELWSIKETHDGHNANNQISLSASTSRKGLLGESDPQSGLVGIKTTLSGKLRILNFGSAGGLASPSGKFRQIAEERDEISKSVPSSTGQGLRERFNGVFSQKIDWASLWKTGKEWIKNPLNMALFLWITCVTVSGAILFLVMTGMLDGVLPKKSQRNTWFEINNQIINALFTLMSLYQHPKRFHHLVLLCRWKPKDISRLRSIYCKNGTYKPNEWIHMMVVIVLLHVNCFAQYALCGLNLGYKRSERPAIGVGVCLSVAIAAPAIAGLYSILSPLGREYDLEVDEEAQDQILTVHNSWPSVKVKSMERRFSFASRNNQRIVENKPVWRGGILDIWEDINLACLSIFCSFCVFGWNMERLGFGNMYVHIATFLLFCTAPFWIFNLAAVNIDNETVREVLGITGIVLCVFGLLYGGFWRIQMRKRFNLPANNLCCGKPAIGDCAHWLFCCCCSLAQEVRTADFYDIVDDKFCRKQMGENEPPMSPLPRENGLYQFTSDPSSPSWHSPRLYKFKAEDSHGPSRFSRNKSGTDREPPKDNSMKPPIPSFIQREDIIS
ncbi:hypothetical protein LOK49_LG10G02393 [Camellia lanceoleosa]|uniref:Uncharacterized protein n=1 Tax=Camellia lanceoleosa TaxID=1840588 RepID=A0ACC0G6E8_9ERIC|nr:hypothetical protein LOK49_LG10G02393 [Camellia lanceoleosa]